MGLKMMLDIQSNLYDLWEVRALERYEEYNEDKSEIEYGIIMNRNAIGLNYQDVKFIYQSKDEREEALTSIKRAMSDFEVVLIIK